MPTTENEFSARLKACRIRVGLSQDELSRRAKVSRRTLIRWESGTVSPWMPELTAVLRALEVPGDEAQDLIRMLGTTRAVRERVDVPPEQMGRTLRTLRLRSGLSVGQTANLVGVNPTTIGRWESGVLTPDSEARSRLFECLKVHPQEMEAIASVERTSPRGSYADLEGWEEQLDGIRWWWDEWAYVLLDLRFLDLLFRLRAAMEKDARLMALLARALSQYANALSNCRRFAEADSYALEAVRLLEGNPKLGSESLAISLLVRARSAAFGSSRNASRAAIRHLDSLQSLPLDRELLSWRLTAYAECYARHGSLSDALQKVGEAVELTGGHLEEAYALRRFDLSRILLANGRPYEALETMPPITEATPGNIASEALLWSRALAQVGRESDAQHWRSVASRNIADYHLEPVFQRQQ